MKLSTNEAVGARSRFHNLSVSAGTRLLRETDFGISETALECGFYDHSAFSRAFHATMGLTPSAYRQAIRKAPAPPS